MSLKQVQQMTISDEKQAKAASAYNRLLAKIAELAAEAEAELEQVQKE